MDTAPTEPAPIEPAAIEPVPTEPVPIEPAPSSRSDRAVSLLPMLAVVALAVWTLGEALYLANADVLLYSLISTRKVTFFYWGQDRLANLVPLVVSPIDDIVANLYANSLILSIGWFGLVAAAAWFHLRATDRRPDPVVVAAATLVGGGVTTLLLTDFGQYTIALEQQYALSTLLFVLGVRGVVGDRPLHRVIGAATLATSVFVIPATALLVPVAWIVRDEPELRWRRTFESAAVAVCSLAAVTLAGRTAPEGLTYAASDSYADFSPRLLGDGLTSALGSIADSVHVLPTLAVLAVAAGWLASRRGHGGSRLTTAHSIAWALAIAWTLAFSANAWVGANQFLFRYFFPVHAAGLLLVSSASCELCVAAAHLLGRARRSLLTVAVLGVCGLAAIGGAVRLQRRSIPVVDAARPAAAVAIDADVELIVGDYWQTWPVVFAAADSGYQLEAVAIRAESVRHHVSEAIEVALASDASVGVLCVGVDGASCLAELAAFTDTNWTLISTPSEEPLRLEAVPG